MTIALRGLASLIATGCLLLAAGATQDAGAPAVVGEVRKALGGEAALAAVSSFSISGSGVWLSDSGTIRYSVRIDCQLPDRILVTRLQSERYRTLTERDGINANALIRETIHAMFTKADEPNAEPDEPPELKAAERKRQLLRGKQWFTALTLLLFAQGNATYPVKLVDGGTVALEHAPARVIEGRAEGSSPMRLFVSPITRLPMAVRWLATRELEPALPGKPTLMPPADIDYTLASSPIEHELCAGDYTMADGIRWPRLLIEYIGGREVEELTLRTVTLNPTFPAGRFDATATK